MGCRVVHNGAELEHFFHPFQQPDPTRNVVGEQFVFINYNSENEEEIFTKEL